MYVVLKPRTLMSTREEYGTLDAIVAEREVYSTQLDEYKTAKSWMPFKTFDEAYAYLRDELNGDCRYFIFEWVGTEYGRLPEIKADK